MLKVELHAHTDRDPADFIPHTTGELIDHAASLGYGALAVTLHDRYFDPAPFASQARERGIVLIPGIERTLNHRHVLLLNFPPEVESVRTLEDVARLKAKCNGLVVAPHPFYPIPSALWSRLDEHAALWDAIEVNAMYTPSLNFNRRAIEWAAQNRKPMVGNTDLHLLAQMGTTYSMVDAPPDVSAICEAIRAGRVEVRTQPLSWPKAVRIYLTMLANGARGRARRLSGPGP